ncbi:MAG: TIGR04086 family membrane protein [Angelakisella sp.]
MKKVPTGAGGKSILENYKVIVFACLIGIITTATILILSAIVISRVDFPQSGIAPLAIGASVTGAFVAGFVCGKITKNSGLLYGFICGLLIFFASLLCEVSFMGGEMGILALYKMIVAVTASMIGSVLGVNNRKKAR